MSDNDNFAIIGGDKRQIKMSESIAADGYDVFSVGFEKTKIDSIVKKTDLETAIGNCQYVILPLPVTRDSQTLNAPYSEKKIILDDSFAKILYEKTIFCGMSEKLKSTSKLWTKATIGDYSEREEFSIRNAVPTAEGAIEIAMREYEGTINGSHCLIAGYGRIGKVLSEMLKGIGAKVTVSARKQKDLSFIDIRSFKSILTSNIKTTSHYDIIFNTIPSLIFTSHTLARCCEKTSIIIDLASSPGGVDFVAAKRLGIKTIQALSLPGKVAPKTAGEIIKTTIYNMIEEGIK